MLSSPDRPLTPQVGAGGTLEPASWEEALETAAPRPRPGDRPDRSDRRRRHLERGGLADPAARPRRPRLGRRRLDRRAGASAARPGPGSPPPISPSPPRTIDDAGAILVLGCDPMHEMPIVELRIRKAVRRNGAKLLVATERPTALDGGAAIGSAGCLEAQRYAPGEARDFIEDLRAAIASGDGRRRRRRLRGRAPRRRAGRRRLGRGHSRRRRSRGGRRVAARPRRRSRPRRQDGRRPLRDPRRRRTAAASARSAAPRTSGPAMPRPSPGRSAAEIRDALEAGEIDALILADVDPVRDFDDPEGWKRALAAAKFTLSISMFAGASARASDVHLPAESHAEKEGTRHPSRRPPAAGSPLGPPPRRRPPRLAGAQRALGPPRRRPRRRHGERGLRPRRRGGALLRAASPSTTSAAWDCAGRSRPGRPALRRPPVTTSTPAERGAAADAECGRGDPTAPADAGDGEGSASAPTATSGPTTSPRTNPALRFLAIGQTLELNPADAERLGVRARPAGRGQRRTATR